ncbi:MAG: hypothetical protein CMM59_11705 [Rhodospirillaceae bacterium]|nr:hypothetical protein [Rhodospirillaceae bacterium]
MSYDDERPTGDELVRKLRRRNILLTAALFGLAVPVILIDSVYISVFSALKSDRDKAVQDLPFNPKSWKRAGTPERLAGGGRCVMAEALKAKHLPVGLSRRKVVDLLGRDEKAIAFPKGRTCYSYRLGECGNWFKQEKILAVCMDDRRKLEEVLIRTP